MGIQGFIKVECNELFPAGLGVVGEVAAAIDFERSTKENRVQLIDPDSGLPLWNVDIMDFEPEAKDRTFKVKLAAKVQPVPPDTVSALPVRPVYLEGLALKPYVKDVGNGRHRVAYTFRATGLAAPRVGNRETKAA